VKLKSPEFLKANPSLMIDTRHFDTDFTARLLESLGEIDAKTDGVLLNSENFQALNLMQARYKERVKCVYIDPPYNTGPSEIIYKNEYKESSWLSLMLDRIRYSQNLLDTDACYAIAIDDFELARLCELTDSIFRKHDRHMAVVNHHPQGGMSSNLSRTHEYMLMMTPHGEDILRGKAKSGEPELRSFMLSGPGENKSRSGRPNSFYALLVDEKNNKIVGVEPPPVGQNYSTDKTQEGFVRRYPISPDGEEKVWCRAYTSAVSGLENGEITISDTGSIKLVVDTNGKRSSLMSNWTDSRYNAGPHGTALVAEIAGDREAFSYPKSIHTVVDAVDSMTWLYESPNILDFFAGSGTTGHAVINLNRDDGGRRSFILVEMGLHFDTVLLPRMKKIAFTPEWKDGKPKRLATAEEAERGPRILKVVRLESYEDTLNNLELKRTSGQQSLLDATEAQGADKLHEQYLLHYLLKVESRESQSLLNVAAFTDPTAYKLVVKRPGSDESREVNVDLLETFNWLLGLTVTNIAVPQVFSAKFKLIPDPAHKKEENWKLALNGRLKPDADGPYWFRTVTGTMPDGRKTLVIWRKLTATPEEDNLVLDEWFTKAGYSSMDSEFGLIYVNGGNNLENLKAPDDTWKVRLIEDDFQRLMFTATES